MAREIDVRNSTIPLNNFKDAAICTIQFIIRHLNFLWFVLPEL